MRKINLISMNRQWSFLYLLVCFCLCSAVGYGQNSMKVSGTVVDNSGEPLIGVSIVVKGATGTGTITDVNGKYSITVPATGTVLQFSYIGYVSQTISVGSKTEINVTLIEDAKSLDEVVVVGYGTQKKATLTGAVTVVSDKIMEDKGSLSSPLQAMQGQVPGVMITRNSTAPGDESWDMKLRGAVSINNAAPLIIIDGVAYESTNALRNINPSDVASINFLKDASAAIYGSRAAGGVVLITTKQAQEAKMVVEYSGSYTLKRVGLQPELMSLKQWANAIIQARTNDGYTNTDTWVQYGQMALANEGKYFDLSNSSNPFTSAFTDTKDIVFMDTNWSNILFGNAGSTSHNLAISGGTAKNAYRISFGYMYNGSNLQWGNNNNNRYNIRTTNKIQVTPWFNLNSVIAYNRQDQVSPSQIGSALTGSYPQPGLPAATIDGKPYSWGTWLSPIWFAEKGGDNNLKVSEVNISEQLTFNLMKGLDLISSLGYNTSSTGRDTKTLAITSYNYAGTEENTGPAVSNQANSSYSKTATRRDFYSLSSYLNYVKSWNNSHNFGAMLGTQYEYTYYDYFGASVKDIQPSLETINGAGTVTLTDSHGTKWHEALLSYFSRLNYNYRQKYLAEVNMRYDGSSHFQKGRWAFFYGISGGWRISEETFMKKISWINELKLRASYGQVGNQSGIDRYEGSQFYNFNSLNGVLIGSSKATTIDTNGKIASSDRTWERIDNYNIGLDFGVLNNRLTGTLEAYMKKNNNMLITVTYPGILGDGAGSSNKGKFEGKGYEGQIMWSDKIGKVSYNIGGVYSFNTNKMIDIGGTTVLRSGFVGQQQNYPLNSIFGLLYTGKIQNNDQLQKYLYRYSVGNGIGMPNTLRLGDNMFEDVNGDGVLDYKDYVYLGTDDPKVSFSFNVGLKWNHFDFSAIFQGVALRTIFRTGNNGGNENWRIPMRSTYLNTSNQSVGNVWSPEQPNAFYPTYTNNSNLNTYNYQASSWSVEDGSYLRLKNVVLGYTLPSSVFKKVISSCRIYLSGADLWEITNINDGWDPEASQSVSGAGRFPFVRTFTCGLDVTF